MEDIEEKIWEIVKIPKEGVNVQREFRIRFVEKHFVEISKGLFRFENYRRDFLTSLQLNEKEFAECRFLLEFYSSMKASHVFAFVIVQKKLGWLVFFNDFIKNFMVYIFVRNSWTRFFELIFCKILLMSFN